MCLMQVILLCPSGFKISITDGQYRINFENEYEALHRLLTECDIEHQLENVSNIDIDYEYNHINILI